MAQPERMTGMLRVCAAHTPDGDRQIMTILPNGARFLLAPAEAMSFAFALLILARDMVPQADLDATVTRAYDRSHELLMTGSLQ